MLLFRKNSTAEPEWVCQRNRVWLKCCSFEFSCTIRGILLIRPKVLELLDGFQARHLQVLHDVGVGINSILVLIFILLACSEENHGHRVLICCENLVAQGIVSTLECLNERAKPIAILGLLEHGNRSVDQEYCGVITVEPAEFISLSIRPGLIAHFVIKTDKNKARKITRSIQI